MRDHVIWAKFGENRWFTTGVLLTKEEADAKVIRFNAAHRQFWRYTGRNPAPLYEVRKAIVEVTS